MIVKVGIEDITSVTINVEEEKVTKTVTVDYLGLAPTFNYPDDLDQYE